MIIKRALSILISAINRRTDPIGFWKSKGLIIGDRCEIYPTASFGSEPYLVELGSHVRINSGVHFITHDGGVWVLRDMNIIIDGEKIDLFGKIKVGNNVHIGTNAMIMPGVTIGNNCIIGCSAVVTKNIPDNSVVGGIPAKVIETIDEYYNKHADKFDYTKEMSQKDKEEYLLKKYMDNKND